MAFIKEKQLFTECNVIFAKRRHLPSLDTGCESILIKNTGLLLIPMIFNSLFINFSMENQSTKDKLLMV